MRAEGTLLRLLVRVVEVIVGDRLASLLLVVNAVDRRGAFNRVVLEPYLLSALGCAALADEVQVNHVILTLLELDRAQLAINKVLRSRMLPSDGLILIEFHRSVLLLEGMNPFLAFRFFIRRRIIASMRAALLAILALVSGRAVLGPVELLFFCVLRILRFLRNIMLVHIILLLRSRHLMGFRLMCILLDGFLLLLLTNTLSLVSEVLHLLTHVALHLLQGR
uniref:Uncharacterized protein n=1 Tax=Strombidium inclinatum TaxID=197538 RepID=A0A7S3N0Z0_9SPIT|mmetsp:Transcript_369/g.311  ORF Transcript_369/g.311 Transcript_369/m.311 type:complete len:222 (+) Transcript_369:327-992(+)